jgi:peptidoglycan/xylan/chitin deacetylase (PgdA/CDA1 family)
MSHIVVKRAIKRAAGWIAVAIDKCHLPDSQNSGCILMYHRTADLRFVDPQYDDWNVQPDTFEEQMAAICEYANVVSLAELPKLLRSRESRFKPIVCVTFDDGYANFRTNALPVLHAYGIPATVFVVTSLVGRNQPMPFDAWSRKNGASFPSEASRSMDWNELERCIQSGLVTVGSHSHTHSKGAHCSPSQLLEEAEQSRYELLTHLGPDHSLAYAYPYGSVRLGEVTDAYVRAVRRAGYQLGVTTDVSLVEPDCDPFLLPRIEVHALDSPSTVHAKVSGRIAPYLVTERLRSVERPSKRANSLTHYGAEGHG